MTHLPSWVFSLRFRGVLLVLLATIPALGLLLYSGIDRRQQAAESLQKQQLLLGQVVAANQQRVFLEPERLLQPLRTILIASVASPARETPAARGEACTSFLASVLLTSPDFTKLKLVSASGAVFCSSTPLTELESVAGQSAFQNMMERRALSIGNDVQTDESGRRTIDFALPVLGPDSQIQAAVIASMSLRAFNQVIDAVELPKDATLTVFTSKGTVLARLPEDEGWLGRQLDLKDLSSGLRTAYDDSNVVSDAKPPSSLTTGALVHDSNGIVAASVVLSVPRSVAYAPANAALRRDISILLLGGVVALAAAWWLSGRFMVRPVQRLVHVTQKIADGDLSIRVGPDYTRGELGELSQNFDAMTAELETRSEQNRRLHAELEHRVLLRTQELEEVNQSLTATNRDLESALGEGRRLESSLQERTVALEAANKELEAFAYSVSHDLRAPLRAIDGFSQTLVRDYRDGLDERGRDRLERVRAAAQRLGVLIDDLLRLSRTSRADIRLTQVNVADIARSVANDLRDDAPERNVEVQIPAEMYAVGDAGLIRSLMQNLLQNAWKFTSQHEKAKIEVNCTEIDGEKVFYVRDDGAGFDMEYSGKLFSAFQRLHGASEFPGTGIGLATVQRIVRRHGGRVWAEGAVEQGATFYFTLFDPARKTVPEEAAA